MCAVAASLRKKSSHPLYEWCVVYRSASIARAHVQSANGFAKRDRERAWIMDNGALSAKRPTIYGCGEREFSIEMELR